MSSRWPHAPGVGDLPTTVAATGARALLLVAAIAAVTHVVVRASPSAGRLTAAASLTFLAAAVILRPSWTWPPGRHVAHAAGVALLGYATAVLVLAGQVRYLAAPETWALLAGAVVEEVVFRSWLPRRLVRSVRWLRVSDERRRLLAVWLSAAAFAGAHAVVPGLTPGTLELWALFAAALLYSCIAGAWGVSPAAVVHAAMNFDVLVAYQRMPGGRSAATLAVSVVVAAVFLHARRWPVPGVGHADHPTNGEP